MTLPSTPSFCIFLFFFQTTSLSFLLFMETNHSSEKCPKGSNKNGLMGQK